MAKSKQGKSKRRKTEVPGQALGYGLQYTRLTQLLFEASSGSFCSLEYLDDIAQQNPDKSTYLIQSKSALTANPVSDRAVSLWKTLSNWTKLASDPHCNLEKTIFEIYVSRPISGGQLVNAFAKAKTVEDARAAIAQARDTLWGEPPKFALKSQVSNEISSYLEQVFNANSICVERIICNFRLNHGSGSPQTDLETLIRTHPISASKVSSIVDHMCGIVKRRVDECLEVGRPAIISRDEFFDCYTSYVRKVDRDTVLLSRASLPTDEEVRGQLPKIFVQQLDIIGLPYEDKLEAVNDYLMAVADRTFWAVSGEVDESSFDDLDDMLKRTWKNKRRACSIEHSTKSDDLQGQVLYSNCMEMTVTLQAMTTPDHFIPGCLHRLADDMSVGWHPDYEEQLKVKKVA